MLTKDLLSSLVFVFDVFPQLSLVPSLPDRVAGLVKNSLEYKGRNKDRCIKRRRPPDDGVIDGAD